MQFQELILVYVESMVVNVSKKKVILTYKPVNEGSSSRKASAACNNLSSKSPTAAWFPSYS
ncbi:hypothetical protein Pint_16457 [Pistacia integerrima]|uniref:Uncharacterized protein n=1 Tax=Pistacia integerrima TaxID=434235 RepID=A0ACC0ZEG7_9ROSI|nr:hypothetical protein Pint_16457 [Pistacia integerrima]